MRKLTRYIILIAGLLLALNLFIVPSLEHSMIYFPTKQIIRTPKDINLKYDEVFLETQDKNRIHGWFIENKRADKVILYFHGNGGNLSHRLPIIKLLYNLPANVFIIDYHGYGKSGGEPSEKNLYLDAKAAYDYIIKRKKFTPSQIILMGSSLGGAVAVDLATKEKISGLVLKNTFTSAQAMARRMSFLYQKPLVWIRSDYNSLKKIGQIKAPILIVHSKEDRIIPYEMSVELFKAAPEPKELILFEKGGHNDLLANQEYIISLRRILGY